MGSGHFLVSLVDWLATRVLEALAESPTKVTWTVYTSPLLGRVAAVRNRILGQAKAHGWPVSVEQLDDRRVVRRMILKRVVFGVDKNPFAVELAKVALWLHTFTVGAPLSFLDHHLRCGDSIVGAWVRPTLDAVAAGGGLLFDAEVARVENIATRMTEIEEITDNDIAEVQASALAFGAVADATRQLGAFFSLMTARHALDVDLNPRLRAPRDTPDQLRKSGAGPRQIATAEKQLRLYNRAAAFKAILARQYGDPLEIATGDVIIAAPPDDGELLLPGGIAEAVERRRAAATLVSEARALAERQNFLHWPVAFPNIWQRLADPDPQGGFDAVIGNPPYVRQEKLSAIKPALAASYKTYAGTADLYLYFFEQGLRLVKPGGRVG